MAKIDDKVYHESMALTSQFKFCPNCFRVDMYRGCDFGCKYCYVDMEAFKENDTDNTTWRSAKFDDIKRKFELAFDTDKESKNVVIELLRHKVPLHCGGMSDPFQRREWTQHLTYQLIELCNKYEYPIIFSTKTDHLDDEYWEILNPELHAFQVSILGWSDEYVKRWEGNTPSSQKRKEFVKQLRDKGFFCSVRIQPIIDMKECIELINQMGDIPSYYSIEHLHIISDSHYAKRTLMNECPNPEEFNPYSAVLEVYGDVKLRNAKILIAEANKYGVKVGSGDNELHYLTQTRNCCGVDLMGENFQNYLKFNSCYLSTGDFDMKDIWIPQSNLRRNMNVGKGIPTVYFKDETIKYLKKHPTYIPEHYREKVEKELFGVYQPKLF